MINFKKALTLFLSMAVLSAGVACSNTQPSASAGEKSPTNSGTGGEAVNLKMTSFRVEDKDTWAKLTEAFTKENPNITVSFEPIKATEYDAQLKLALQSGTAADIIHSRTYDAGRLLMKSGYLLELNEQNMPGLKEISKNYLDATTTLDGKVFAVPANTVLLGFLYNKDIFQKYNLSEPKTWDDFFKICDTLKKNGVRPLALNYKDGWVNSDYSCQILPSFLGSNAEQWHKDLLAGKVKLSDQAFADHLSLINRLKDYAGDGFTGIGYSEAEQLFISGQAAIYPGGSFDLSYLQSMNPNLKIDVFATPNSTGSGAAPVATYVAAGFAVNKASKHQTEALKFISWLGTQEAAKIYMQNLYGMPLVQPKNLPVDNAVMKKWIGFEGSDGNNIMLYWEHNRLSSKTPTASSLTGEAIQKMWAGQFTPKQASAFIQNGISWYKPSEK